MIAFNGVALSIGNRQLWSDLTFQIAPGECVGILGDSGSGKSAIVSLLIGDIHAQSGTVEVDGADVAALPAPVLRLLRRRIGVVFQDRRLFPDCTVTENVRFPLTIEAAPSADMQAAIGAMLERLKLADVADCFPDQLSEGQRTRVALARALIHQPTILLLDEPTAFQGSDEFQMVIPMLLELHAHGATVIVLSSDMRLADALHARVLRLHPGSTGGDVASTAAEKADASPPAGSAAHVSPKRLSGDHHVIHHKHSDHPAGEQHRGQETREDKNG